MASDKSGTLSPSCLLLVEMEKGGRGDQEETETGDDHLDEATLLLVHLGHNLHWLLKGLPDLLSYDPGLGRLCHLDLL